MPPPSLSRRGRQNNGGLKMWLVIAITAILALGIGGAYYWTRTTQVPIDQATLCPATGPTEIHAILVDRSDPITPLQQTRVRQVIERIVSDASAGARVAIYVADSDGAERLTASVALCNPGREANALYQNPRRMRERYELEFKGRLDRTAETLLQPNTRNNSPIMESIKALCVDAFGRSQRGDKLTMTIISDMIQHSPIASHYRDRDYDALLRSPRLQSVFADCKGADVDIVYLLRPQARNTQTRRHQQFWDVFLQRMNARPRNMEPV